ncbi:amidohydrolase [Virgibacillus necropolis]|uniref:Peptidase M20 n=1 Tax=Virgibacillus necropolis TaxID=163877 RepID=A0A221M942_9BACI|nr:amidohydrolase [Virgibacillus necropolis]ASN04151.1 peptidase M20 [Virgibacillus necropolis]
MPDKFVGKMVPTLTEWRRTFHQYPELGFMEYVTTYKLGRQLEELGFNVHIGKDVLKKESRLGLPSDAELRTQEEEALKHGVDATWLEKMRGGFTGLVATWDAEHDGDHVAFRYDIDALPINEAKDNQHIPYQDGFVSTNDNIMHACGHDGHMTIGLGVATFIAENHKDLKGRFTLLFQPAEEGGRGAKAMTENGWLDEVDYFYTGHIGISSLPIGTIAATIKGFLATTKLNANFSGVASHAGMKPELGKNALIAATTAATQLYTIPRHSDGISRVNVGKIVAGSGRNIIPDKGYLEIEVRGETKEINHYMLEEAKRIMEAAANMYDVTVDFEVVGGAEEINCNDDVVSIIKKGSNSYSYIKEVLPTINVAGSEDASFMINKVQDNGGKATYMLFGTKLDYPHHHRLFDFQEEVLAVALETYVAILKGGSSK